VEQEGIPAENKMCVRLLAHLRRHQRHRHQEEQEEQEEQSNIYICILQ
jgi:hypothetical protein